MTTSKPDHRSHRRSPQRQAVNVRGSIPKARRKPAVEVTGHTRAERLQRAVYEIAQAADAAASLDDLYRRIHTIIAGVMPANNFYIALYDAAQGRISFPYFVDEVDVPSPPKPLGRGLTEYVLRTGQPILCDESTEAELHRRGEVELIGVPSPIWLGVPLRVEDKTIGVMVVQHYRDPHAYGESERQMLEFVSSQVAQAIQRKANLVARAQAEAALQASEERYRNLFENAPIGIYRTTPEGQILLANPALLRMIGVNSVTELAEKNPITNPASGMRAPQFEQLLADTGFVRGLESLWYTLDGRQIVVSENAQVTRGPDGRILYYDGTVEDITERKRIEEAERQQRMLSEALIDTAAALSGTLDRDELLDRILSNSSRVVPHDAAFVMLTNGRVAHVVRTRGYAERNAGAPVREFQFSIDSFSRLREMESSGQPCIIPDTTTWPEWPRMPEAAWVRSELIAPIRAQEQLLGFLVVDSAAPNFFTTEHSVRLLAFADQAAGALENARLLAETRQRAAEFAALYETARDLATWQELPVLLELIVERAILHLASAGGFIYLYDSGRRDLELIVEKGGLIPPGTRIQPGEGVIGRVAQTHQALLVDDYAASEYRDPRVVVPYAAVIQVPMLYGGELIGVLGINEIVPSTRHFTAADAQLLSLFAGQAASAVRNARLLQETRARAQQLALLYDAGLTLNSVLEPRAQLEFLLKIAMRALHAERAEFFRYEQGTDEMVFEFGVGFPVSIQSLQDQLRFPVSSEIGLQGWVYQHRVPLNIPDLKSDPRFMLFDQALSSGLWAPVEREGHLDGVITILSTQPSAFSLQDERLMVLFANQAAVALENARLYVAAREELAERERIEESLRGKIKTLQTLAEIGRQVTASTNTETVMQLVCRQAAELLHVPKVAIGEVGPRGIQLLATFGIADPEGIREDFDAARPDRAEGLHKSWQVLTAIEQIADDDPRMRNSRRREGIVSIARCTMMAGERSLGDLVVLDTVPRAWSQDDLELLTLLAGQAAIALERTHRLNEPRSSSS